MKIEPLRDDQVAVLANSLCCQAAVLVPLPRHQAAVLTWSLWHWPMVYQSHRCNEPDGYPLPAVPPLAALPFECRVIYDILLE